MLHFLSFLFTEIKHSLESVEGGNWLNVLSSVAQLCSDHFTGSDSGPAWADFFSTLDCFAKFWEWKQSHKTQKSCNWIGFFPMNYIRTLPRVSFHLCLYSLIRGGKKIICRGGQFHYLLFTDVEVKAQKDEVHLFQVIQQSKWQTENRTKSFSAHSVASRCLPVLMKTSEM